MRVIAFQTMEATIQGSLVIWEILATQSVSSLANGLVTGVDYVWSKSQCSEFFIT